MSAPDAREPAATVARVGGVALARAAEALAPGELRSRACTELLRQQAIRAGLLGADDPQPSGGVISEAAADAIEALLELEVDVAEPDEAACRRHYAAHAARYTPGERVRLRHVLFAVTPGVDVDALRARAEACLIDLRATGHRSAGLSPPCAEDGEARAAPLAQDRAEADTERGSEARFAAAARALSNCPSGAGGGELGWLSAQDCAPEFAREVFGRAGVGVLPRLVATRFGLHVVEVLAREAAAAPPFEAVRGAVAQSLRQQAFATALRAYLQQLAAGACIEGIDLDAGVGL